MHPPYEYISVNKSWAAILTMNLLDLYQALSYFQINTALVLRI